MEASLLDAVWYHLLVMLEFFGAVLKWLRDSYAVAIVTILGFIISLWAIRQTYREAKKATSSAEAASRAVTDLKKKLYDVNVVTELATALSAMEEIKRLQRVAAWQVLPDRYSQLRSRLNTICTMYRSFTPSEMISLQLSAQQLRIAEETIEKAIYMEQNAQVQTDPAYDLLNWTDLNKAVSEQMERLEPILGRAIAKIGD